ncbi:MAG: sigma-70 family RNA polymerase sigma factor [Armatimonadetes bacterium]|nr:sigma-70 family RNA polymerase sigma factor [Armatimonadota bacterium]
MTDKELAKRICEGDLAAAEEFARGHYPAVLRLAVRLAGRQEDAEDIAQETFLTARQKIHTYRGRSSLRTWIHRIALNHYRQWRRKRTTLPLVDHDRSSNDGGIAAFETGHVLLNAMRGMEEKQREAFVLFEVEQLSMSETAQVLGVPVGTAKARVHYARQYLRRQLEGGPEVIRDAHPHTTH